MGVQRLDKHSARLPRQGLFGPLSHMWLFDKALRVPDRANGIAWVMHRRQADAPPGHADSAELDDLVWRTLVDLSPVAVLPHWREPVLAWCRARLAISTLDDSLYPALGPVQAVRISLSTHFTDYISQAVGRGELVLQP
jgi:hypothetical protein